METGKNKNVPTVFIIFGATGDLMTKKIAPALFHLYLSGKFPKIFKIIAFSRRDIALFEFKNYIKNILISSEDKRIKRESINGFLSFFEYQKGDFDKVEAYHDLANKLGRIDGEWKACSNKLFYLAVPPINYERILVNLKTSGLSIPCGPDEGWTRVIVEKPFGRNAKTALKLDILLGQLFKEDQIYRIDHYLGKDMMQNILSFRFVNDLFEETWDKDHIEKIDIKFLEEIGVENRASFYDGVGALRDVGQNHMLQMLAFITMEKPKSFTAQAVRTKRADILSKLSVMNTSSLRKSVFRGQYEGYLKANAVTRNSTTETYFKLVAYLDSQRFKNIPIILEAGKNLENKKEICITFRHQIPCLCPPGIHYKNRIFFTLEPKEGITIDFWSKKPGLEFEMERQKLSFLFRDQRKKAQYVEEYEKLLLDCISGNQILFVSTNEVKAMWRFIDPIISFWEKGKANLHTYKPHTRKILKDSMIVEKNILE